MPDDCVPPYLSFVARHATGVTRVVMACFAIQYGSDVGAAEPALARITQAFAAADGPRHWDCARWTDATVAGSLVCAAYWDDTARFDA